MAIFNFHGPSLDLGAAPLIIGVLLFVLVVYVLVSNYLARHAGPIALGGPPVMDSEQRRLLAARAAAPLSPVPDNGPVGGSLAPMYEPPPFQPGLEPTPLQPGPGASPIQPGPRGDAYAPEPPWR